MKQKDIVLIVGIALFAGIISLVLSKIIFVAPANRQVSVQVVEPIGTSFNSPSSKYFNANSIDPTLNIQIGGNNNPAPFKGND